MVKVDSALPLTADGRPDVSRWASEVALEQVHLSRARLLRVASRLPADRLAHALELANLLVGMKMDTEAVCAGMIYREVRLGYQSATELEALAGKRAFQLARSVAAMATTSLLEMSNSRSQDKERESQVENVKRMIVAMVDDPRVAIIKLAERLVVIRNAKDYEPQRRLRIASEVLAIFAPLAGRLGIAQLKWELEDFAFRYTQEQTYKKIAKQLRAKRAERELQVAAIRDRVLGLLNSQGIDAQIYGRAKHIYSIWRKMQAKQVSLEQVYDVQALRIVVDSVAQCYACLGVIHTTWPHIPSEFDDYVANPKENGYQSIHTAVTLNDGRTLEIQIRTEQMHAEAELGLCAHWTYKGDADDHSRSSAKMDWLRQVIEWHEDFGGTQSLSSLLRHRVDDNRIYVSTPKGHVLDLHLGATVLDFAYRVHTDVGHSCRGALIDGKTALLHEKLQNGQQVSIITGANIQPRREWLEWDLGFVASDRARAKIAAYFRSLSDTQKAEHGHKFLASSLQLLLPLQRDAIDSGEWSSPLCAALGLADYADLCIAVGSGDFGLATVVTHLTRSGQLPAEAAGGDARQLLVQGDNRDGLLNDITQIIFRLGFALVGTSGRVSGDAKTAYLTLELAAGAWTETLKLVSHLRAVEGVVDISLKQQATLE